MSRAIMSAAEVGAPVAGEFRLFASISQVIEAVADPVARDFYALLQRMRTAVRTAEPAWASYPELQEYANICFWAIRKLEYSFATRSLAELERGRRPLRILDVGCGVVPLCNWISARGHEVVAVDPARADIEFLLRYDVNQFYGSSVEYQVERAEDLPFEDESFDLVTCVSVLEHLAPGNDRLAFWEIARVLKPGGHLIITFDVAPPPRPQDGEKPWPPELRRYRQPFSPLATRRLLDFIDPCFQVAPAALGPLLDQLTWDQVAAFWRAAQAHDRRTDAVREYVAAGAVLERAPARVSIPGADRVAAYHEGQQALTERLQFYETHAERRLNVIEDLKDHTDRLATEAQQKDQVIAELGVAAEERLSLARRLDEEGRELKRALEERDRTTAETTRVLDSLYQEVAVQRDTLARLEVIVASTNALLSNPRAAEPSAAVEAQLKKFQVERDRAQEVAEARLAIIEQQQRAIEHYRRWRPRDQLSRWTAPRIGQLYQYSPRKLVIPSHYHRPVKVSTWPTISIVTPTLNQGEFIERTIRSVLDQNYPSLQYAIQDGGSVDETLKILERHEPQLAYIESGQDAGFGNAINRGFAHVSGEILAYLNSDDVLLPGTLGYVAKAFADDPCLDVVYGHRVVIDEYDAEIGRWVLPGHDDEVLSWADYVPQETLFWRRRIWDKVGGAIDESFRFAIDWDLLLRFRDAGAKMRRLPRFLGAFRVHPHQKTSAQMQSVGEQEMSRLRERCHNRTVLPSEIDRALRPYLRRHFYYHKLYRLGLLRY